MSACIGRFGEARLEAYLIPGGERQSYVRHIIPKGFCVLLLVLLSLGRGWADDRIVAVADVHGSYSQFVSILQSVGLMDSQRQWIGGSSILVQTGDVVDRGTRTRECLELLMALEQQAARQNGQVIPLLGNHEVMDMAGDFRYVSREDYASFADEQSEARREQAYKEYRAFVDARRRRREAFGADESAGRKKWMEDHPRGFFEFRDAFGPDGVYGRWLRQHDAVAQVGGVIFLHGGLSPRFRFRNLHEVNERVRSEIRRLDELLDSLAEKGIIWRYMTFREALAEVRAEWRAGTVSTREWKEARKEMREFLGFGEWAIVSPDGPLWYRGYGQDAEKETRRFVEKTLARFNAHHIVVGHTSIDSRSIRLRLANRVFFIDTNMLIDGRGGRTSALEIRNETFTAHYSGGEQQILLAPETLKPVPAVGQGGAN